MTTDLEALARRAMACPRWRWMPGMRWVTPDESGRCDDWQPEGMARPAGALPDFSDHATLGCLIVLVREAWGDDSIEMEPHPRPGYRMRLFSHRDCIPRGYGATRFAALVAALEAAP